MNYLFYNTHLFFNLDFLFFYECVASHISQISSLQFLKTFKLLARFIYFDIFHATNSNSLRTVTRRTTFTIADCVENWLPNEPPRGSDSEYPFVSFSVCPQFTGTRAFNPQIRRIHVHFRGASNVVFNINAGACVDNRIIRRSIAT